MSGADVAIVDAGGANIASLQYALDRIDTKSVLTADPEIIGSASHVILPGVGAAVAAMQRLDDHKLADVIRDLQQPVLGICLGMQLLSDCSAEGGVKCLGIFPSAATRLCASADAHVPNMGWCQTYIREKHQLLEGIDDGSWFYYVHSFALPVSATTVATAIHAEEFAAIESMNNFHAVQFHPERSSDTGSRLLRNFLAMPS